MSLIEGFEANHNFSGLIGATEVDEKTPLGFYHIEAEDKIRVITIAGEIVEEYPVKEVAHVRRDYDIDEDELTEYGDRLLNI